MIPTKEHWKDVVGFEEYYKVSNLGNIFSVRKNANMVLHPNTFGYMQIVMWKDSKPHTVRVHKAVARAFLGESRLHVNHINGIKTDNRVENLECVTNRENLSKHWKKKKGGMAYLTKFPDGYYRFSCMNNGKSFNKYFKYLDDAVVFRNEYMEKNHGITFD